MWLHRGNATTVATKMEEQEEQDGYFVRSEIELGGEEEGESGVVECIVMQKKKMEEEGKEVAVAMSSMANLVILRKLRREGGR